MTTPASPFTAQITNTDGSVTNLSGTVVLTTTPPPAPPAPVEPTAYLAWAKVNLDNNATWKGVYDTSTPKTASGATVATASGRRFTVAYTNRAGFRFSCHAVASGAQAVRNIVYETIATFNWSQVSRFELDTNIVVDAKRVFMLCLQQESGSPTGSGMWDLTFSGHWAGSNVRAALSQWKDGSTHTIRTHASVDDNGVVTYIGVAVDDAYSLFTKNNVGSSVLNQLWQPLGVIIPNFQFEGSGASGTIDGTASINLYYL